MKREDYLYLIGKSDQEVFKEFGNYYCNYSHSDRWLYKLKKSIIEYYFLYVYFDNNIVIDVKFYGN
ncbi:hypothetical protein CLU97_4739 [Chryseobacterium sp. 7]|nr:hypothetical protein CLU97_4739 [Chryseobacterium sp. 7]